MSEPETIQLTKDLQRNPTKEESLLWSSLKKNQLGFRFVRKKAVSNWILDFYCSERRLSVQIEKEDPEGFTKEAVRDFILARKGIRILQFTVPEVRSDTDRVLSKIRTALYEKQLQRKVAQPTNGKPIGLLIRSLRRKGYSQLLAAAIAFKIAQNPKPKTFCCQLRLFQEEFIPGI